MHMHKYEKIWLVIGIASLVAFLAILAYGAFWKGTHPQSAMETLDPENVEASEHFQEDNLGLTKVDDKQYVLNVVATSFISYLENLTYGAFRKRTHPQSAIETLDPENVEASEHFQEDNLGLTKVDDKQYVLNVVASSFNFDLGTDEEGDAVQKVRIPKGSSVL